MMVILIIAGLILLILGLISLCMNNGGFAFLLGIVGAYMLSGGILMYQESHKPTALDVYQGKTDLRIIYKDSIPVDIVVVFKEKINE